jgi:hypothetical protein
LLGNDATTGAQTPEGTDMPMTGGIDAGVGTMDGDTSGSSDNA